MDTPLPILRPWTPPDDIDDRTAEPASTPPSYFPDPFRASSPYDSDAENRWPTPPLKTARCDTPLSNQRGQSKRAAQTKENAPFTPTKSFENAGGHGAPQYPYTPDSSRILSRSTQFLPASPSPWSTNIDTDTDAAYEPASPLDPASTSQEVSVSSPVQNALSSCIAHFETLIHARRPDEAQMEFLVNKFEDMAACLGAPEVRSRGMDDALFDDAEPSRSADARGKETGLGINGAVGQAEEDDVTEAFEVTDELVDKYITELSTTPTAYVKHVTAYVAAVGKHIADLKTRLDEIRTLNGIQLDAIADLRQRNWQLTKHLHGAGLLIEDAKEDGTDQADEQQRKHDKVHNVSNHAPHLSPTDIPPTDNIDIRTTSHTYHDAPTARWHRIHIVRRPSCQRSPFWAALAETLDWVGGYTWTDYGD